MSLPFFRRRRHPRRAADFPEKGKAKSFEQGRSRTISRILCLFPGGCHSSRATVSRRLQQPTRRVLTGPATFLFGLAPDGVCLACRVAAATGGLLPRLFTLTPADRGGLFLWHCPGVAPAGCYPASCPVVSGLSSPGLAAGSDSLSGSVKNKASASPGFPPGYLRTEVYWASSLSASEKWRSQ